MLLLRHNPPLPDLDASSLRLRSSSYPSYNTIPSKQFTHSPPEEILSHYVHTTFPLHPPLSMYSSSQDQRNESLVDSWLPSTAGTSADVSHPADASSTLAAPSAIASKSNNYSPSHTVTTSTTTAHNDQTRHARFHHTPGGSPSDRHQSFSSQHHPSSLNRHLSEPNIRAAATQPPPHYPFSHAAEARYQQQQRRPPHRQSFQHGVTPVLPSPGSVSVSADRRPSTAGSAASSSWESRGAEPLQGITATTQTHDLPPIAAGDQNTSPVERYPPMFANPFGDHNFADARPRSSGIVGADPLHSETAHSRLHSPASSLVPVARHGSEEEHDIVSADPAISKTYSFVSLPGNAVKKRPRRRYDEIERLYHCSWSGCTKSYGTLNHLNAHIVMQRHGSKRTPAEFKELRKQWRKAKKDESDRMVRLERPEDRYSMRSEHAALPYPSQAYERHPRSVSYGGQRLYGPGIPGPEMDQLAVSEAAPRYPLSTETSSMRPQPLQQQQQQQQYSYPPIPSSTHPLYSVVPHTPISSSWPEQATQYEASSPPQHDPAPGQAHLPTQPVYDYERERQGQSWTPPAHPPASRPVPSYEVSPSYPQPQSTQRVNTLPPDSTLLTPLPGYQPSTVEPEYEEEYDNKQQFWTEQQQQQQQQH